MVYKIEELLPVMAKLSDKYTSKDSASVSYETAQQLMEAILYCIQECGDENKDLLGGASVDCMTAYEQGYRFTMDKVMRAKEVYHRITSDFEDYGCRNYRETIIEGMPMFFTKYDVRFEPQNHILSLDYPALGIAPGKRGIDLIMDYLEEIEYEQHFLKYFKRKAVTDQFPVRNCCRFCYNIIYYTSPLFTADLKESLRGLSPAGLRMQFSLEDAEETARIIRLCGDIYHRDMPADLKDTDFTRGHFKRGVT